MHPSAGITADTAPRDRHTVRPHPREPSAYTTPILPQSGSTGCAQNGFAGLNPVLLGLFTFACAVTPANINKASK